MRNYTTAASAAASASSSAPTKCIGCDEKDGLMTGGRITNASTATAACRLCPTRALKIVKTDHTFKDNANWTGRDHRGNIPPGRRRAACCSPPWAIPSRYPVYWDKMLINASQVTNPSIDPLREPMETKVFLGKKTARDSRAMQNGRIVPTTGAPAGAGDADNVFCHELRLYQL